MTESTLDPRRQHPRVRIPGVSAVVRARVDESAVFAIRDLSAGGARLVGQLRLAEGERIKLLIELEGQSLALSADVVWTDPQAAQIRVEFRDVSSQATELIDRSVVAMLDRVRSTASPTVLVMHPTPELRAELERDLARLGRATICGATALEVMWHLEDRSIPYEGVMIAGELPPETLSELLLHLVDHHPELRRVMLFREQLAPLDHLSSSRIHAVIRTPWHLRGLARALAVAGPPTTKTYDLLTALSPSDQDDG